MKYHFLIIGIILLVINTPLGIMFASLPYDFPVFEYYGYVPQISFVVWILGIILIPIGIRYARKKKAIEKQKEHDEIQELKDKVEKLEKDKEKKD